MSGKKFGIEWAPTAVRSLSGIADKRVQRKIFERAEALATHPESQGKALIGPLAGYRSIRAVSQRYRIVYRVERGRVVVIILTVGIRKDGASNDIYALAKKLVRLGLLGK
jgi:mRNA interferase RelE/StbE